MTWSLDDNSAPYGQSAATLADRREAIRAPHAYLRRNRSEPIFAEASEPQSRLPISRFVILTGLTLLAVGVVLVKLFLR